MPRPRPTSSSALVRRDARTTLFRTNAGWWLQVENSADHINEANPFTLATNAPKPRITLLSMDAFEEGWGGTQT